MADGDSPAADMVMYGPRGMGKTVLLNWLVDEAKRGEANDNSIRTSSATPNQLKNPAEIWGFLLSDEGWKEKLLSGETTAGFDAKVFFAKTWKEKSPTNKILLNTLISECKKNPLVFLLDEAHKMEPEQCLALLNISQQVQNEAPFLLVLAGTPGLSHFLTTVNASFVERSDVIGIGRLDAQATADAIVKPLNEHGIEIDDTTLAQVVEDSQHYPYFIQLWGAALWDLAKEKDLQKLTSQEITEAETKVENRRLNFYEKRRKTLSDLGLLPAAVAIATIFQDTETTTMDTLIDVIADNSPVDSPATQSVNEHLQTIIRHEFIWNPPDTDLYEAGIPSLMKYVLDRQREHVQERSSKPNQEIPAKNGNSDLDLGP
ncbi:ATP-binding protein [Candidatus Spongiihabitans sp.]|uniref:ATP-binding protein n=1 Tax=Candidatus Spongiihabitans sp. TaxID=3101308 RepID=UPI003C7B8D61